MQQARKNRLTLNRLAGLTEHLEQVFPNLLKLHLTPFERECQFHFVPLRNALQQNFMCTNKQDEGIRRNKMDTAKQTFQMK